ncbi:rho GTPase-activating protein 27 isoform X1 [Polypterus senegalus]|uniref:rho GTPase-activating protein 27 isoform X1 n=1 Tax=Polypterus senegalus TaxID=55291 RepID=UPI001963775D|nr:rho GTPase-activating protein 27 isoform X1 [Polypterus senegalus]
MTALYHKDYVLVEYEFQYTGRDGDLISIKPNERYILLSRTNDHWWHVQREDNTKPFYVPAKYVKVLPAQKQQTVDLQPAHEDLTSFGRREQKTATDIGSEHASDGQVTLRAHLNVKAHENRMSTFGIPQNINMGRHRLPNNESVIALKPVTSDANLSPLCLKEKVPQESKPYSVKRHSLEPTILSESKEPVAELYTQSARARASYNLEFPPTIQVAGSVRPSRSTGSLLFEQADRNASVQKENQPPLGTSKAGKTRISSERICEAENIYETIPDVLDLPAKRKSTAKARTAKENPSTSVYANVEDLKQKFPLPSKIPLSPVARRHFSETSEWEVHTDKQSGQEFYYNPGTGVTTWDNPFSDQEDPPEEPRSPSPSGSLVFPTWEKVLDEASGQYYFYNPVSGETSWDLPEEEGPGPVHGGMEEEQKPFQRDQPPPLPEEDYPLTNEEPPEAIPEQERQSPSSVREDLGYSSFTRDRIPHATFTLEAPDGWSCSKGEDGNLHYTNNYTQEQWVRSTDERGKPYFYSADGTKSEWELPEIIPPQSTIRNGFDFDGGSVFKNWRHTMFVPISQTAQEDNKFFPVHRRNTSDHLYEEYGSGNSAEFTHQEHKSRHRRNASDFSAQLALGHSREILQPHSKTLEKAGVLNKTKVSDSGKRHRKNWASSWTVLQGGILTFYKDPKTQPTGTAKQVSSQIVPEFTVELRGASISWASKEKSSKKNVIELRSRNGSEYLIQHDKESIIGDWYKMLAETIRHLGQDNNSEEEENANDPFGNEKSPSAVDNDEKDRRGRTARNQSVSSINVDQDQKKVRTKLRKFLQRRPTYQSVKEKGYIKDQVFGCHLNTLCERENSTVPSFVKKCIEAVEKRGLDIDGIYRVSGNLAVIQKLRYKVDHEENLDLNDGKWEDIHVITGALKLFFRELPEPLFPFSHFENFIAAAQIRDATQKSQYMRELVNSLPQPNLDTMKTLFEHLIRVTQFREKNRMSTQSVAIVFGPTLLKSEEDSINITLHMACQNQIVEYVLKEYDEIFQDT